MASEWARQKAEEFFCKDYNSDKTYLKAIATMLDAARAEGRREGLEEAAKIVALEKYAVPAYGRIRILIAQEPTAEEARRS